MKWVAVVLVSIPLIACGGPPEVDQILVADALRGEWRSVLESPGGDLPFGLRIGFTEGRLTAVILNHNEEVPTSSVSVDSDRVVIEMDWYDSRLEGRLSRDGLRIDGSWTKVIPGGVARLGWVAEKNYSRRFEELEAGGVSSDDSTLVESVGGHWKIAMSDDGGVQEARGEFVQEGRRVTGTILTGTGDYRFLEGSYESGVLRLSTFDGAHAFLFQARATADGGLVGDFWSRDSYHATWTAERIEADVQVLPDPWNEVVPTAADRSFRFSNDDLTGGTVSSSDQRFEGKVVLVNIFGSWCVACQQEHPFLVTIQDQGLVPIFGIDWREKKPGAGAKWLARYGDPYTLVGDDPESKAAIAFGVTGAPESFIVDQKGIIRYKHIGPITPKVWDQTLWPLIQELRKP